MGGAVRSGRCATASGGTAGPARRRKLVEWSAAREALVMGVPVLDVGLAEAPAQPDRPAGQHGREVDEPVLDVAELDVQLDEPRDAGLHLVDEALHPEADPTELLGG